MNPVIGLDISRGESQVQAFLDKGKPYRKSIKVLHTNEALDSLLHFLKEAENELGMEPMVILESTGHYHVPIIQFLEKQNYLFIMVNAEELVTPYSQPQNCLNKKA
ncbi:IS110 family transposase [Cytobacillus firmus]|uniref:IS110 family transposase n=1 Tax=Cytobacillus firmus TaxID=1399 RepID=UPI0022281A9B|nr:IS110 family transposase [Cytobacillus firmus]